MYGSVEHHRRLVLLEDLAPHRLPVLDVDELRQRRREVALRRRARARFSEEADLGVDEDQPGRADAARSGGRGSEPDRAAGARDEHGVPLEVGRPPRGSRPRPALGRARPRPARTDLAGEDEVSRDEPRRSPGSVLTPDLQLLRCLEDPAGGPSPETVGIAISTFKLGPVLAEDAAAAQSIELQHADAQRDPRLLLAAGRRRRTRSA